MAIFILLKKIIHAVIFVYLLCNYNEVTLYFKVN